MIFTKEPFTNGSLSRPKLTQKMNYTQMLSSALVLRKVLSSYSMEKNRCHHGRISPISCPSPRFCLPHFFFFNFSDRGITFSTSLIPSCELQTRCISNHYYIRPMFNGCYYGPAAEDTVSSWNV